MAMLDGKVALVSGGARGIGAAIATEITGSGAYVVIGDVLDAQGEALASRIGPSATYVHLDVTDAGDWELAVDAAVERYGKLDVLVNNAGIAQAHPIDTYPHEEWERIIGVNLTGAFNGIQAAVPALKAAGGGSIVNISSVQGLTALPATAGYIASKFGLRGLTKAAAIDLGLYNIRVNSVHPGFIVTEMTAAVPADTRGVALGRPGRPQDVANLVVYLASDRSSFSTGAEFVVDGGESAGDTTGGSLSALLGPNGAMVGHPA